jgi:MoaA/NifB/PqqE/SkfB family radical SAM enzyme
VDHPLTAGSSQQAARANGRVVNIERKVVAEFPRVPLDGSIDLTYRCNRNCRHCWLWLPENADEQRQELTFDEIRRIVDEARALGTREWDISGGEPMLRPDFPEIFEYITRKARAFTLNTNGTLITPRIAQLLKRPGAVRVSVYGATAEVYDRVTRSPGGFAALLRGLACLKEAGTPFIVQLFPLRENWHQWSKMIEFAQSQGRLWRVGAPWLNLSASGDPQRDEEIRRQRLDPADVIALDPPPMTEEPAPEDCGAAAGEDRLFSSCATGRRQFHIDPYGGMSICCVIKDPSLRYDLRRGTVREGWEVFIPGVAEKVRASAAYAAGCGACELRSDCRCCAAYAFLEHRDHSATVEYLCEVAREHRRFRDNWVVHHRRHFSVGGVTIQVDADLPIADETFLPAVRTFSVSGPSPDTVSVRHHFSLEGLRRNQFGQVVYRAAPWTIYRKPDAWVYECGDEDTTYAVGVFSADHGRGTIYHRDEQAWRKGGLNSLSLPITDQILITRLLSEREACLIHSAGVILNGKGLLFAGHSEAGKTTTTRFLEKYGEVLCDDRNISRLQNGRFQIYGTWSHGDSPLVSTATAPLHAMLFLRKSSENRLTLLTDRKEILRRLLSFIIRGFVGGGWWDKTLDVVEKLVDQVPCYEMESDTSGRIVPLLRSL